jgi:ribonuclease HI
MKTIEVFTDGSSIGQNNKSEEDRLCGYGIYFPNKELPDVSRKFRHPPNTNQRAELHSIYVALIMIKKKLEFDKIKIYTDSMYGIKCLTVWGKSWEENDWKTATNKPVKNQDILKPLYDIVKKLKDKVEFKHVNSHTGKKDYESVGNEMADKLATSGARK